MYLSYTKEERKDMEEINHFSHKKHPLKLIKRDMYLSYTKEERKDMEEINHFSHKKHPLKLIKSEAIVGASFKGRGGGGKPGVIECYACQKPISSGFAYACIECRHFLHKVCAQVPETINYPSVYHQPLKLYDFGLRPSDTWHCLVCNDGKSKLGGFCYFFTRAEYNINFIACIACCLVEITRKAEFDALKEEAKIKVEHEGHPQHSLTLQLRPAAFRCDACNAKDEGLFYQCDSCDFWIHKTCASLAPTIDVPHHPNHPLVLVYSLPEKFFNFAYYCEFCDIYIQRNEWLYHCANCRYFAHIKCALNAKQHYTPRDDPSSSVTHEDKNDLLHFPMLDMFTDPLKLINFEKTTMHDNETLEITHWSHHHPLILNAVNQGNTSVIGCSDPIEVCVGCVRPLSFPYYSCKDGCSFTLHKYCAELPVKLKHRLHPDHSLDLINSQGHPKYYKCIGCYSYGNTFLYICETCNFYLDVNCAFLPNAIKHKSHKHPLTQVMDRKPLCNACDKTYTGMSYTCKPCNFILNMHCAMRLPQNLAHKYCKGHEIPLTNPPVVDHPEDFYCDICEAEMHPKFPLYYCYKCRNSFHLLCINRFDYYANIFFKGTKSVSYHKHPILTFVRRKKTPKYVCSNCNRDINGYLILECGARLCDFNICYECHYNKVMP